MKRLIILAVALMIPTRVFADPCAADYEKFCKNLKGQDAAACFDQHKSELSSTCQSALQAQKACADDTGKFCKGVKWKKLASCLGQHKSELSSACQSSYESLSPKSN
jgi:hypothetical protein